MTSIVRRVAELEKAACPDTPPEKWEIVGALYEGEPEADVIARWRAEHPDEPTPAKFIILVPVAPAVATRSVSP